MNCFEKILLFLQGEMNTPTVFGWFHLICVLLTIISIIVLYKLRYKNSEKQLKLVLFIYGFVAFVLELLKQLIWTFNYDSINNIVTWNFEWYAFPFQLCTTPIYVSLICLFLKNNNIRKSLLSYLAFVTILGSIVTIIMPNSCFVSDILVNIHTMWLHCGSFVVSVYLLMNKIVELNYQNLGKSLIVFLIFVGIALTLNIVIYNSGILSGETFDMFYISPYFITTLPVFNVIQKNVPYVLYLATYISAIAIGSFIIFFLSQAVDYFIKHKLKVNT